MAKNKYVFHRDPRDPCFVFFQDPLTHEWHQLRWVGLPEAGRVPAFSDARVRQVMRELRSRGLAPQSDKDLLPLLLDLLGDNVPVEEWPTRLSKAQRTEIAREEAQAAAAAADRPEINPVDEEAELLVPIPRQSEGIDNVVELPWRQRVEQGRSAIDDVRRRRREAETHEVTASAPLGQRLRTTSLRELLDDEADTAQEKTRDHP